MNTYETNAIELLMNSMNYGVVYVDADGVIRFCNKKAKEITGIIFDSKQGHGAGELAEGDIVVLADTHLGSDDGELSLAELSLLNINDKDIKAGDMLLAIGVYKNKKIEPEYKYLRQHQLNIPMRMAVNYLGFFIESVIDTEAKETCITVNGRPYRLPYYYDVGNMVVIDGKTGDVKFFQAKGYSVRKEDAGYLLRGALFRAKSTEEADVDVTGEKFLSLFDKSAVSQRLFDGLSGKSRGFRQHLYEINKRPFICSMIPRKDPENEEVQGAYLILQDAVDLEALLDDRNEIIRQIESEGTAQDELRQDYPKDAFREFVGKSSKAREVKYMAYKASKNRFNVIITGESGTGKSKLAREIHALSDPGAPFVEVNCNAIAPTLFESELFGYVGGAFTGAKSEGKVGFFEAASGGTIFLDEIGEIPLEIQVKLLHVLQNKIIYRVGSSKPIKVDVRVIAATNKNLEEEVARGRFRQDLFYRINVFPIEIPPIRERKADLYLLINQILLRICDSYGFAPKQFSGEALRKLTSYNWPGNVRELENAIERAVTLCDSNIIYSEYLKIGDNSVPKTMKELLAKEEAGILEMTLIKYNGDKQKTMEELDMSRSIFYDKLKKYQIKY